ncbi:hypothetical protein NX059_000640 [Plenodomus lindquistii]|nr:hypothetical protein NX059_000640 [Plenodomus lindquistii]
MSACESLPEGLPPPLDRLSAIDRHWRGRLQEGVINQTLMLSALNDDSPEDFWASAVESYTSLSLTKQIDKRMAIWGIAKLVRDSLEEDYAVGMWGSFLEEQLAWKVIDPASSSRPDVLQHNPSWAWVSVNGRIKIQDRADRFDRVYHVKDHHGQPLSFDLNKGTSRPKIPRQTSGDQKKDIANMSKDLELVDERRRKSSASSRHGSQVAFTESRNNPQVSIGRTNSDIGRLFEHEKSRAQPPLQKVWSWKAVEYKVTASIPSQLSTVNLFPALFINVFVSAHQYVLWFWGSISHALSTFLLLNVYKQHTAEAKNSSVRHSGADPRDMEPELSDKRIAVQGYIHQGELQWSKELGGLTLSLGHALDCHSENTTIEVYPDTRQDSETGTVSFVVLALSQKYEPYGRGPEQKTWYEGYGIMLRPSGDDKTYLRMSALHIR